jgi:hypothetical protein
MDERKFVRRPCIAKPCRLDPETYFADFRVQHYFLRSVFCMSAINLYVGNLSYNTTESELRDLFASYGEVESAKIISDRDTGRSKGFGFVEMSSRSDGEQAIAELNGKEFGGRTVKVNEARPRTNNRGGGGGRF